MTHDATDRHVPGFATLAIHAGARPEPAADARDTAADPASRVCGAADPACRVLEERVAALEGGTAALAASSGQAARLIAFQTLMEPGDEFIASTALDGGAIHQFDHAFARFGWRVRWADPSDPGAVAALLGERTRAIVVPSLAGEAFTDIGAVAAVAGRAGVPLVVDNTLATPYLVRPIEHGADIVLHHDAASLCGHGHASAGLIVDGGGFDWLADGRYPSLSRPRPDCDGLALGEAFGNFAFATACRALGLPDLGGPPSPLDASLVLAGLETLPLRMRRRCDNALAVATFLARHPAVSLVDHPGLSDAGHRDAATRDLRPGAAPSLSFGLRNTRDAAVVTTRLRLVSRRAEVADTRSQVLALAPPPEAGPGRLRLTLGIEDAADLVADLDQALAGLAAG